MTRARRSTHTHIVIAAGAGWSCSWPIDLWETLTEEERREVVDRQTQLLAAGHPEETTGRRRRITPSKIAPG